jgi:hypothetical protein
VDGVSGIAGMKNPERMATTVADAIEMCTEPLRARIAVLERDTKSLSRELAELRSELAIETREHSCLLVGTPTDRTLGPQWDPMNRPLTAIATNLQNY